MNELTQRPHPHTNLIVTSSGDVYGARGNKLKFWTIKGYRFVKATKPKYKSYKIARLVAETFISNPENKPEVNHINGNKSDDRVENLEWATRSENQKHAFKIGLQKPNIGSKAGGAKLSASDVKKIRSMYLDGRGVMYIARNYGVSYSNIISIVNHKSWKHI